MIIKVTGTEKLIIAFKETINETFKNISLFEMSQVLYVGTENEKLKDIIDVDIMSMMSYILPYDWDKALNILKTECRHRQTTKEKPLDKAQNYFNNQLLEKQISINTAKDKGYSPGMWIWNGEQLEQINWNAKGLKKGFKYEDNCLYLNDTCICEGGEWKVLLKHGHIYRVKTCLVDIIIRFKEIKQNRLYGYSSFDNDRNLCNIGYSSIDYIKYISEASEKEKEALEMKEREAGYKWDRKKQKLTENRLRLFGYDIEDNGDTVNIGCKKNISKYLLDAIVKLSYFLEFKEAIQISTGKVAFYNEQGQRSRVDSMGHFRNILAQLGDK